MELFWYCTLSLLFYVCSCEIVTSNGCSCSAGNCKTSGDHGNGTCIPSALSEIEKGLPLQSTTTLYEFNNRPFKLEVSVYEVFNNSFKTQIKLSFDNSNLDDHRYQYQIKDLANPTIDLVCEHNFGNQNTSTVPDRIFRDCRFFPGQELTLTVFDERGLGGEYAFTVPEPNRTISHQLTSLLSDRNTTAIQDWEVFFFYDVGYYKYHEKAAVTLQRAPFNNLNYGIELRSCEERSCQKWKVEKYLQINESTFTPDDTETVTRVLDMPGVGLYAISVQILHDSCPDTGCHKSLSKLLEVKQSSWHLAIIAILTMILITQIMVLMLCVYKRRQHNKLLSDKINNPVSMLIVYLPENPRHYELVKTFANFLRETCKVNTLLVDESSPHKSPIEWTFSNMMEADHVVYIIPSDRDQKGATTVREQWNTGTSISHYRHNINNDSVILIPTLSSTVPNEIRNLKQFEIIKDMTSFISWIYKSTTIDKWLLWWPLVTSSNCNTSLTDLKSSLQNLLSDDIEAETSTVNTDVNSRRESCEMHQQHSSEIDILDPSETSSLLSINNAPEFDKSIPSVEDCMDPRPISDESSCSDSDSAFAQFCT